MANTIINGECELIKSNNKLCVTKDFPFQFQEYYPKDLIRSMVWSGTVNLDGLFESDHQTFIIFRLNLHPETSVPFCVFALYKNGRWPHTHLCTSFMPAIALHQLHFECIVLLWQMQVHATTFQIFFPYKTTNRRYKIIDISKTTSKRKTEASDCTDIHNLFKTNRTY